MEQKYFRGEIYYISPTETTGSEQSGGRPAIIVSNDFGNEHSSVVEVVYLTTREKKPLPTHVEISSSRYQSLALCEQIETVSKKRIGRYLNAVSQQELNEIDRALLISLGINSNIKGCKKLEAWEKLIKDWESNDPIFLPDNSKEVISEQKNDTYQENIEENIERNPKFVQACTERDVYKELYLNLLKETRTA